MEETKQGARTDFHKHEATHKALFDFYKQKVYIADKFKNSKQSNIKNILEEFTSQLRRVQIKPKGGISGKGGKGERDDMAIGYIMMSYFARKYLDEVESIQAYNAWEKHNEENNNRGINYFN